MNNYEPSTVIELGKAHDVILGMKAFGILDSEGAPNYQERVDDIDETEE